ncbi:MAG: SPOR domain-containing protein [Comamonadaceae bacterium]|nr:MAG: SPOR domain-containing protein [Comamonadaceae bacterium]
MLRWAITLLLLANLAYFAWTQGHLDGLGMSAADPREPQRITRQVKPEVLRLLNGPKGTGDPDIPAAPTTEAPPAVPEPAAAAPAAVPALPSATSVASAPATASVPPSKPSTPPPAPPPPVASNEPRACWMAAGFTEAQTELLRAELALLGLSAASWQLTENRSGGRWIVYMGRYDNTEQVERKKAELRGLGVSFREITAAGLAPGLALGTYSTEAAARVALQKTERDGVRTAKVAQERAESLSFTLRLPAITPAQRAAVDGLGEAMAGKALRPCS